MAHLGSLSEFMLGETNKLVRRVILLEEVVCLYSLLHYWRVWSVGCMMGEHCAKYMCVCCNGRVCVAHSSRAVCRSNV